MMPKVFMQHFDYRRQAVGGAGGVGDDVVLRGVVFVLVHAEDDGEILVGCRRGDDDLFDGDLRWALALVASVKWPVDSTTTWAPTDDQSSLAGSRSAKTLIFLPSTAMKSSPAVMS